MGTEQLPKLWAQREDTITVPLTNLVLPANTVQSRTTCSCIGQWEGREQQKETLKGFRCCKCTHLNAGCSKWTQVNAGCRKWTQPKAGCSKWTQLNAGCSKCTQLNSGCSKCTQPKVGCIKRIQPNAVGPQPSAIGPQAIYQYETVEGLHPNAAGPWVQLVIRMLSGHRPRYISECCMATGHSYTSKCCVATGHSCTSESCPFTGKHVFCM